MSYETLKEDYTFWFSGAMWGNMCSDYSGVHGGSRTIPGRFGARASRIGRALFKPPHVAQVSDADRHAVVLWLDSNSLRLGAYQDEEAQLRGELVWPVPDLDPRNPLGVEGTEPSLRRNFWHQNHHGPFACLISEHAHDRVAILDEQGRIQWEFPVEHPQDVWMLPDGNVLTTWSQGVMEVTRDKQVVWEYRTPKPNEIAACQPLPGGKVLIGIEGECRLIEVNRQGEIVHEVKLQTTSPGIHGQFRMCRKTAAGTYLVPFTNEGAVREYDAAGAVVREFPPQRSPVCALRLPNGNTLVSSADGLREYDGDNRVVWQLTPEWLPDIRIGILAGIQRLPNGDTIVCN